jgi:hypothetical protein
MGSLRVRRVRSSVLPSLGAILAAATGAAGIYYESTPMVLAATLGAVAFIVTWFRLNAPHDHWREFRRKRPSDP